MIGRWHSAMGRQGFLIAESSSAVSISKWMQSWTDLLVLNITPVFTEDEVAEVIG